MKEPNNIIYEVNVGYWKQVSRKTWFAFTGNKRWKNKDEKQYHVISGNSEN